MWSVGNLKQKLLFPPGFEPGTFRVLGERDNHYTTETRYRAVILFYFFFGQDRWKHVYNPGLFTKISCDI